MREDNTRQGPAGQTDPEQIIAEAIGFEEVQSIMGRWAGQLGERDGMLDDVLLVLTAVAFNDDASARQTLLDAATRPLIVHHGAASEALKAALVARARTIQAA